jgi:hypothetical protein
VIAALFKARLKWSEELGLKASYAGFKDAELEIWVRISTTKIGYSTD